MVIKTKHHKDTDQEYKSQWVEFEDNWRLLHIDTWPQGSWDVRHKCGEGKHGAHLKLPGVCETCGEAPPEKVRFYLMLVSPHMAKWYKEHKYNTWR
jgi:hypothetical protein